MKKNVPFFDFLTSKRFLLFLLLVQALFLLFLKKEPQLFSDSKISVEMGKNYSLLVDNERFPIPAQAGQIIWIRVLNKAINTFSLPPNRTKIYFSPTEESMSKMEKPRFLFYYDHPRALASFHNREKLSQLKKSTDWETITSVLYWTQKQFPPGQPGVYPSQNAYDFLPLLRNKQEQGFCAQYAYVMVQALQSMG